MDTHCSAIESEEKFIECLRSVNSKYQPKFYKNLDLMVKFRKRLFNKLNEDV